MRLTKVETKGFKSFADKTTLTFDGGVVGVVGPNGSGKSNINDAIKWVLGEGSAKQLRGDSMDDIIFAGSKTEPASDKAEVSLTFDNSKGENDIPHKNFTITRILKRGGQSEYFINGEEARLKDIKDIAMESGISKSSLAIISQGTVQDIAQATPEQRREIFEEAAGVSKYKARKEEALRKLDKTTETLKTIDAVAEELEKKLKPLKRQAEKATLYLEKQNALKEIEVSLIVEQVSFYSKGLDSLSRELESVIEAKDDTHARILNMERDLASKNKYRTEVDAEVTKLEIRDDELGEQIERINVRIANAANRRKTILSNKESTPQEKINALYTELTELAQRVEQFKSYFRDLNGDVESRKSLVRELQEKALNADSEIRRLQNSLLKLKTRISIYREQRDNMSHLHQGVKVILENKKHFRGVHDILANLIKVEDKYKSAIEASAQSSLQNIVISKSEDAVAAINFLKANRAGRATFLPLNTINPKTVREDHYTIFQTRPGFIGSADQLVKTEARFEIAVRSVMGNIIVMDTIDNAEALSKALKPMYTIVTLEGDIIRPGGSMTGGARQKTNSFAADQDVDITALEAEIPQLEKEIIALQAEKSKIEVQIEEERNVILEKNTEVQKYRDKIIHAENVFSFRRTEYEAMTNSSLEITSVETEMSSDSSHVAELESERSAVKTLRKAKRESAINLANDIARIISQKTELEKLYRDITDKSADKLQQKAQAEYIIKSQSALLLEHYQLTVESAKKVAGKLKMKIDEASEIVLRIKQEMREIGNVNLDSIEEYEVESKRFEKLDSSRQEIRNAYDAILNAISQMDQVIITKLDDTVQQVNKAMQVIFKVMFGGGTSAIKYTNPSNLLETGIDVIAQPPGKTVKNLKLFSGGEKALVAISLLFAILKAKPLPLCILDEVEAALDDANVIRFANYLQELKAKTQFIVVTHRVGTMARVDHLFGATMQKRGVTSFFAVELAKARELISEKAEKEVN